MYRKILFAIALICFLLLAVIWLDHCGYLQFAWNKIMPETIMERKLSIQEKRQLQVQTNISGIQSRIEELKETCNKYQLKQKELETELADKLNSQEIDEDNITLYLEDNPIVAALVRSIDLLITKQQEAKAEMNRSKKLLEPLFARQLALDNGVSDVNPQLTPGDAIDAELCNVPTERQRYIEILRQNGALTNRNE